jgi:hypothetical protein
MIKDKCFKDCPSFVKSLGAWGGDFVLASKFGDYKNYFLIIIIIMFLIGKVYLLIFSCL